MYALKNSQFFLPITARSRLGDTSSMAVMDNFILHQDPWQFYSFMALGHSYIPFFSSTVQTLLFLKLGSPYFPFVSF